MVVGGCRLDWRQESRVRETRGCPAGSSLLSLTLKARVAQSRVTGPALYESSPWTSGDWGLSCGLTLCFPSGSECVASCLDHNSESIILPVNLTVRDIPHWLNPTRVEVSDRAAPRGEGRAVTPLDTRYAPSPHQSLYIC